MALPLLPILLLGGAGVALLALSKSGSSGSGGAAGDAPPPPTGSKGPGKLTAESVALSNAGEAAAKAAMTPAQTAAVNAAYAAAYHKASSQAGANVWSNQGEAATKAAMTPAQIAASNAAYQKAYEAGQKQQADAISAMFADRARLEQGRNIDNKSALDYASDPSHYQAAPARDQGPFPSASSADYPMTPEEQARWSASALKARQNMAAHPESDPCRCECVRWRQKRDASRANPVLGPPNAMGFQAILNGPGPDPGHCGGRINPSDNPNQVPTIVDPDCAGGGDFNQGWTAISPDQFKNQRC